MQKRTVWRVDLLLTSLVFLCIKLNDVWVEEVYTPQWTRLAKTTWSYQFDWCPNAGPLDQFAAHCQWPNLDQRLSQWVIADTTMWPNCGQLKLCLLKVSTRVGGCRWPTINKWCPLFTLMCSKSSILLPYHPAKQILALLQSTLLAQNHSLQ